MTQLRYATIYDFAKESNEIERCYDEDQHTVHATALTTFIELPAVTVEDVELLVSTLQPDAILRDQPGLNVMVGGRVCPLGGPVIRKRLQILLERASALTPHELHVEYEFLHPFTDGNGRSGRALWLWCMHEYMGYVDEKGYMPYTFLQMFYYQTLGAAAEKR